MNTLSVHKVARIVIETNEIASPDVSDFYRTKIVLIDEDGGRFDISAFASERSQPIPIETLPTTRLQKEKAEA